MTGLELLAFLRILSELAGKLIPITTFISGLEAKAGKKIGDMTDVELAALLDVPTATPDELIGDTDPNLPTSS